MLRRLLHLLRPEAPQRPALQVELAQETADGQGTRTGGAGRQVGVPGLHRPAGRAAVLPAGGSDGRVVLGTGRRGPGRRAPGQRGCGVRPAHRAAQRSAAHAARPRVRYAHQEAAGTWQEPDAPPAAAAAAAAATATVVVRRSGHQ